MILNAIGIVLVCAVALIVVGLLYWGLRSTGLQEADDPTEAKPEEMTEFEKRHTHRSDVQGHPN